VATLLRAVKLDACHVLDGGVANEVVELLAVMQKKEDPATCYVDSLDAPSTNNTIAMGSVGGIVEIMGV
jgi:hypothetical protein